MAQSPAPYASDYGYEEWDWDRWKAPDVREAAKPDARPGEDIRAPFAA